jgi:hypothetical protein
MARTDTDQGNAENRTARAKTGKGGYGDPPVEHQFQKGKSGNPKGRPKGAKRAKKFDQLLYEALQEPMDVTIQGKPMRRTKLELGVLKMANDFVAGKFRSQKAIPYFLDIMDFKPEEYQSMQDELRELRRREMTASRALQLYEQARKRNPYLDLPPLLGVTDDSSDGDGE